MHQNFHTHYCEANHCRISEVTEPSAPEIATTALALLILALSVTDWHVPRWLPRHQLLCKILTAVCMHTLRMDYACTTMAFLLPTFRKRPQKEGGAARKRRATMSPATEQTWGHQRTRMQRCRIHKIVHQCRSGALLLSRTLLQSTSQQGRKP